jgi:hypothetical protein
VNALVPVQTTNAEVYRASTNAAGLCKDIVLKTAQTIQGRKYVKVEGWQAIAIAHGCAASADHVERVEDGDLSGYRAVGIVRRMSDGAEIARAEGFLGDDEGMWAKRPVYARRAMVQTRAISRACRSAFAHVVVLIDSNLSTTPAEEVPAEGFDEGPRNVTPRQAPKAATAPPTELWRTLAEEMDACRSVEELEAWDRRRGRDISSLAKPQHAALGKKYQLMAETLPAKLEASTELTTDDVPEFS